MTDLERLCQAAQRAGPPMKSARSYEPIVKAVLEEFARIAADRRDAGFDMALFEAYRADDPEAVVRALLRQSHA